MLLEWTLERGCDNTYCMQYKDINFSYKWWLGCYLLNDIVVTWCLCSALHFFSISTRLFKLFIVTNQTDLLYWLLNHNLLHNTSCISQLNMPRKEKHMSVDLSSALHTQDFGSGHYLWLTLCNRTEKQVFTSQKTLCAVALVSLLHMKTAYAVLFWLVVLSRARAQCAILTSLLAPFY